MSVPKKVRKRVWGSIKDSKGALYTPHGVLNQLAREGYDAIGFFCNDIQDLPRDYDGRFIDISVKELTGGDAAFSSGKNILTLARSAKKVFYEMGVPLMKMIQDSVNGEDVRDDVFLLNSPMMLFAGPFLMELGFEKFIVADPYRYIGWGGWTHERTQIWLRNYLALPLSAYMHIGPGRTAGEELLGYKPRAGYFDMKRSVVFHANTISRQFMPHSVDNTQFGVTGYPYVVKEDLTIPETVLDFIETSRDAGKRIAVFTIGSMEIITEEQRLLIDKVIEATRASDMNLIVLGFPARSRDDVLFEEGFVPYTSLFPMIDFVITHGGSGSAHSVLRAGVPSFFISFLPDQSNWGEGLINMGTCIGVEQYSTNLDPGKIISAIHSIDWEQVTQRSGELAASEETNGVNNLLDVIRRFA